MRRIGWLMIFGLLAACAPTVVAPTAVAPTAAPALPTKSNAPVAAPTSAPAAVEPTVEVKPTETAEAAPTPHAVKAELEATDPSTVQLAAGKPQLVEFFAFW